MRVQGLTISTPLQIVVQAGDVVSIRVADDSGSFGVLPGHVPMLTVIRASVLQWRGGDGVWRYCALRGGVLTVDRDGVRVACREAVLGDDLSALESEVERHIAADLDAARRARVQQTRMHTEAVRQIMHHMRGGGAATAAVPFERMFE